MNDSERVERLARVLEDHPCWADPRWRMPEERRDAPWRTSQIDYLLRFGGGKTGTDGLAALRAAIAEVEEPFAVFGSPTRCAVCGTSEATLDEWPQEQTWLCTKRSPDYERCCAALRSARDHVKRLNGEGLQDWTIRLLLRARRLYRGQKAKQGPPPPRIFTGVDYGEDGSCCTVRLRREEDGRWTLLDEVYEPRKPQPSDGPQPVKPHPEQARSVWRSTCARTGCAWRHGNGMACVACTSWQQENTWTTLQSVEQAEALFGQESAPAQAMRDAKANPQRATVYASPARTPHEAFKEAVQRGATPHGARWFAEHYLDGIGARKPTSGNPRGDEWLREVWRDGDKETEILRRVALVEAELRVHSRTEGRRVDGLRAEVDDLRAGEARQIERNVRDLERVRQLDSRIAKLERATKPQPVAFAKSALMDSGILSVRLTHDGQTTIAEERVGPDDDPAAIVDRIVQRLDHKKKPQTKRARKAGRK